jgi:CRISPR/Cas system CSM-associated protein Csm4 (group 5 of RAMP superfamily)
VRRTAVLPNSLFPEDISTCFIIKNTDEKKDDENCIEKTKELLKEQGITGDMFITLDQLKKEYKGEQLYFYQPLM